jgi:glycosyltransferase involved in cell wall biosynthesis
VKKVLLVSNRVMHYRVPVYNYFHRRFKEQDIEFIVRSDELQKQNPHRLEFDFSEVAFRFDKYKREIERIKPDVVIVFLHLRDAMIWPLIHWLKLKRIPVVLWSKAKNYDRPDDVVSGSLYKYVHVLVDGLILYADAELACISPRHRRKAFVANNTVNFESYPEVGETREEIKTALGIPFEKVVLSVGRMDVGGQRKKVDHLVDMFRGIEGEGIGLVIVGSGLSAELRERMNPKNTLYLGEVHDPRDVQISRIFKMADVFCLPGHAGLGLNQAFHWGLPVITEDGLHPPEIHYLINGRNGYMVPANDIGGLREKILYLLTNDEKRRELSENARNDIAKTASIDGMFMGFKRCVDAMTAGRQ